MTRPLRVLLAHPGASWSTADVYDGLKFGLLHHDVDVIEYRLDWRIEATHREKMAAWRRAKRIDPTVEKPTGELVQHDSSVGLLIMAMERRVDVVIVVSAMLLHPNVLVMLKEAGKLVTVLFTETPYDLEHELKVAALVDGCWTNERTAVPAFRAVNPRAGYLPHAWEPRKHYIDCAIPNSVPSHDVVFVGSCFPERAAFFNAIDWTGIDMGLYGFWVQERKAPVKLNAQVRACIRGGVVANLETAALYQRAKIGLNLYRHYAGTPQPESLSPRAYEYAASGVFHLSDYRKEVLEVFGDRVPTFTTPQEAESLIRYWLAHDDARHELGATLPACVVEQSWIDRAEEVIGDLHQLVDIGVSDHGPLSLPIRGDVCLDDWQRHGDERLGHRSLEH